MGDFAIVAEGITDQIVLRNILEAWFADREDDLLVAFEQPPNDATGRSTAQTPGGWGPLIHYFEQQKFIEALQTNTYLVAHIDTDVADEYGVPVVQDGDAMVEAVVQRLRRHIPEEIQQAHGHRFLFAIGHQSIECWLLPLVIDRSKKAKLEKITGCVAALNEAYKRENNPVLRTADHADPIEYDKLSRRFSKRKDVVSASTHNAGFRRFVEELRKLPK